MCDNTSIFLKKETNKKILYQYLILKYMSSKTAERFLARCLCVGLEKKSVDSHINVKRNRRKSHLNIDKLTNTPSVLCAHFPFPLFYTSDKVLYKVHSHFDAFFFAAKTAVCSICSFICLCCCKYIYSCLQLYVK